MQSVKIITQSYYINCFQHHPLLPLAAVQYFEQSFLGGLSQDFH